MKKIIAYNEVNRAIVSAVKNGIDSVDKITIFLDQDTWVDIQNLILMKMLFQVD